MASDLRSSLAPGTGWMLAALLLLPLPVAAADAIVEGTVLDAAGLPLAGARIALAPESRGEPYEVVSGPDGAFRIPVAPGRYTLVFSKAGYTGQAISPLVLADGESRRLELMLEIANVSESVEVTVPGLPPEPSAGSLDLSAEVGRYLPLPMDRFAEALPLVPGVVRGPDGRLSFNGARASQSLLLVNGANVTDPLTGEFAVDLPMGTVEQVQVYSIPYSAEYGRLTSGVADVRTRAGSDQVAFEIADPIPRPDLRGGKFNGIRRATPRVQLSGPLWKGRAWFSQGLAFRYVRLRVYDVETGSDHQDLESFDSHTQFDVRLGDRGWLTTTFSYFPLEIDKWGLDTLHPESSTPDFQSHGWNAAVEHRHATGETGTLTTRFAYKRYDVAVIPQGEGVFQLGPDGARGAYFNEIDRRSHSYQLDLVHAHDAGELAGTHFVKAGVNLWRNSFSGIDRSQPVEIRGRDGELLRTIEFRGDGALEAHDRGGALFVQDRWQPHRRLGVDAGFRFDFEDLAAEQSISPRLAAAWQLDDDGRTVVKAGVGYFHGHVYLHAGVFPDFQQRVERRYDADGRAGEPLVFDNAVSEDGLDVPRAWAWHVELNRELLPGLLLRAAYRGRRVNDETTIERVEDHPAGPRLLLSGEGDSRSDEGELSLRKQLPDDGFLVASYVASRTRGELNEFGMVYGDRREPLLLDGGFGVQQFDAPHRVLLWGVIHLPADVIVAPQLEWRSGFPYTVFDADYAPVGERNRGGRFPDLFSLDLRVTKGVTLFGRRLRLGFQAYNLTNHSNPRDIWTNRASERFGRLANGVGIQLGLRIELDL